MNRNYHFGKKSLSVIDTTKPLMQKLNHRAMAIANNRSANIPDWSVISGLRTEKEQYALYSKGRDSWNNIIYPQLVVTYNDGRFEKSSHQSGYAIDYVPLDENGKPDWSEEACSMVACCYFEAACEIGLKIKWGGNFTKFFDGGHIEIVF